MCGIAGIFGNGCNQEALTAMVVSQNHRGPDATGIYITKNRQAGLGHNRLSIIDLSQAGQQPMSDASGRYRIVFNGEIYNYLELRAELSDYPYQSRTDTEVVLAAYQKWGASCLEHFIGMFALLIWDEKEQSLFAARDRFGVKPLYYHTKPDGTLLLASEIKAIHAAGIDAEPNASAWATYLTRGLYDHSEDTFWSGIKSLPQGHKLVWKHGFKKISRWYDLAEKVGNEFDSRSSETVKEEYLSLLKESVNLRFRSDVPVGINLSGGLDSSTLLGLVHEVQGAESDVKVFTFTTGDDRYDELPWVLKMLERTHHPFTECRLTPEEVPDLATSVQAHEEEPFGGLPTLAYARLFEEARKQGVTVLLDGNGLDEQWGGYDYYLDIVNGSTNGSPQSYSTTSVIQGVKSKPILPECLTQDFRAQAKTNELSQPFSDTLRNLQYRDTYFTKLIRSLRFNDRISMRSSSELREPFLDHRLFELAFRQPTERKIVGKTRKWLLRQMTQSILPQGVVEAPKRPMQTPQREWLRGDIRQWADDMIELALKEYGNIWLDKNSVKHEWEQFCKGHGDNSFYIWQWISLGLVVQNSMTKVRCGTYLHNAIAAA